MIRRGLTKIPKTAEEKKSVNILNKTFVIFAVIYLSYFAHNNFLLKC